MAKRSKRISALVEKVGKEPVSLSKAVELVKETSTTKFDASIDVAFNLNLNPTQAEQQLRGAFVLPHGSGRSQKILVFAKGDAAKAALEAGADYVGEEEYVQKIQKENWFDFDVVIATPDMMAVVGRLGQTLGPKGLMPNPKTGTVTPDAAKAVTEVKAGKITYRVDKNGQIHAPIGKASFDAKKLEENVAAIVAEMNRLRPTTVKGTYMKNLTISSTMGPGIKVDTTVL